MIRSSCLEGVPLANITAPGGPLAPTLYQEVRDEQYSVQDCEVLAALDFAGSTTAIWTLTSIAITSLNINRCLSRPADQYSRLIIGLVPSTLIQLVLRYIHWYHFSEANFIRYLFRLLSDSVRLLLRLMGLNA